MPHPHHDNCEHVILDGVDDPVISHPDPEKPGTILQSTRTRWARISGESEDRTTNACPDLRVNLLQIPLCCRQDLDGICHFVQPRSFMT